MIATVAPPTTCPRCGARLRPEEATAYPGPPGYPPVLTWRHTTPQGGKCVAKGGRTARLPARPCPARSERAVW